LDNVRADRAEGALQQVVSTRTDDDEVGVDLAGGLDDHASRLARSLDAFHLDSAIFQQRLCLREQAALRLKLSR
jgi:hypothetical protein